MKDHPVLQHLDSIPPGEDPESAEFSLVESKVESATLFEVSLGACAVRDYDTDCFLARE